jgi:hypothetical protein
MQFPPLGPIVYTLLVALIVLAVLWLVGVRFDLTVS